MILIKDELSYFYGRVHSFYVLWVGYYHEKWSINCCKTCKIRRAYSCALHHNRPRPVNIIMHHPTT